MVQLGLGLPPPPTEPAYSPWEQTPPPPPPLWQMEDVPARLWADVNRWAFRRYPHPRNELDTGMRGRLVQHISSISSL